MTFTDAGKSIVIQTTCLAMSLILDHKPDSWRLLNVHAASQGTDDEIANRVEETFNRNTDAREPDLDAP